MKLIRTIAAALSLAAASFAMAATNPEVVKFDGGAEISIYSPEKSCGAAVLICPGGGYQKKCLDKEGYLFAPYFNELGITLAVLDYRLPEGDATLPVADAYAALSYLHNNASTLGLDPDKIGIMGGSAGGHLAAQVAVTAPQEFAPKFQILLYPVISMVDTSLTHRGSREHLLGGKSAERDALVKHSPDLLVTTETPQAFIVLTADDLIVDPENSMSYARALRHNGVGCELHMFAHGSHGFGANDIQFRQIWLDALTNWLNTYALNK